MRDRMEDAFVKRFETEILSGQYVPGDRLPAERDLAESHGVSRPVVHGAMRQLAARGLLRIEARRGIFVSDFRREGSVEMLLSLINFAGGDLAPGILDGLLEMRLLLETETARLAALRAAPDELADIERVLAREVLFEYREPRDATLIDRSVTPYGRGRHLRDVKRPKKPETGASGAPGCGIDAAPSGWMTP